MPGDEQAQQQAAQAQQQAQPSKRSRAARAATKQGKLTGGTAPGSIMAFFKPKNGAGGGGRGPASGNCFRCGAAGHVSVGAGRGMLGRELGKPALARRAIAIADGKPFVTTYLPQWAGDCPNK